MHHIKLLYIRLCYIKIQFIKKIHFIILNCWQLKEFWFGFAGLVAGLPLLLRSENSLSSDSRLNFNFVYLAHPRAVTGFSWRRTSKYLQKQVPVHKVDSDVGSSPHSGLRNRFQSTQQTQKQVPVHIFRLRNRFKSSQQTQKQVPAHMMYLEVASSAHGRLRSTVSSSSHDLLRSKFQSAWQTRKQVIFHILPGPHSEAQLNPSF